MKITQLLAINNANSHMSERILMDKLYQGDSEGLVYEFLNDLNDDLSLGLSSKDIEKVFMDMCLNSHTNISSAGNRRYDIYLSYKVEEL